MPAKVFRVNEIGISEQVRRTADRPFAFGDTLERLHMLMNPAEVQPVTADPGAPADREGRERGAQALPGPFTRWEMAAGKE